jgi:aspartyl-tRNA(Asn)/glutamyl-tRNA(Gln) amidotransferase subunit A
VALTIEDAASALREGSTTSRELTDRAIEAADKFDASVGAFLARFTGTARDRADRADQELAAGVDLGPLLGIPLGIKDILAAAEGPTTAQSLVLDPAWGAGKDSPVTRRLRAAGAVIVGKTTTLEFAMGFPDTTRPFPVPRNPWDLDRWAGGSSSGTGSGVAAGMMLGGIGTDTGASIRMPAAFCGVTGLKPTYSLVPKSGCTPLGYSLDVVGPLARSAWDCGAVLGAIAGHHPSDPTSSLRPAIDCFADIDRGLGGLRIGVMRTHTIGDSTDPEVVERFDAALSILESLGAMLVEVSVPLWHEVAAAMMVTTVAEGGAYHHPDLVSRWDDFFHKTRTAISWGSLISGAEYVQAQRVRRAAQHSLQGLFRSVDVVATPTVSGVAPPADSLHDINNDVLSKIQTPYWSAVGNPAIALPIGFAGGLPVSLQLAGRPFDEPLLVRIGHGYQQLVKIAARQPRPEHFGIGHHRLGGAQQSLGPNPLVPCDDTCSPWPVVRVADCRSAAGITVEVATRASQRSCGYA